MTASPIARIVVVGLLLIAGAIVLASVGGSLMRGEPVDETVIGIAGTCIGFAGGVLAKTTFDALASDGPQEVTITDEPVEVTQSVRPPDTVDRA